MLPASQTGPWVQAMDSGAVSSGGMTCSAAGGGWQSPLDESPVPGTGPPCSCELAEPPGLSVTVVGAGETRFWWVGSGAPDASTRPMPPYPLIVQVRPLVLRRTSVAWRWPAPESPGCRLPARSVVWQRPLLPLLLVDVEPGGTDPLPEEPLVTGAAEDDDVAPVLVVVLVCDELEPPSASVTEP